MSKIVLATAALTLLATAGQAQDRDRESERRGRDQDTFTWSDRVRRGSWLRVYGFNGPITVTEASGDVAEVRGAKRYRGGGGEEIEFQVVRDGDNVTICALRSDSTCDEDGLHSRRRSNNWRNGDQGRVEFTVRLPRGVRMHASSGNGEVDVTGAGAEVIAASGNGRVRVQTSEGAVKASTGNGDVTVEGATDEVSASSGNGRIAVGTTRGPVSASTGNGNIDVRMDALGGDDDMEFSTGNGRITVHVPNDFTADLEATLGHGEFQSDFPMTVRGRLSPTHVRATIGDARRRVRLSSGNGNIEILKRSGGRSSER
jgi:hypothetical protein